MRSIAILGVSLALAAAAGAQEGSGASAVALLEGNALLRFDPARPAEVTRVAIRGVDDRLLGIDRRPSDGRLYAVSDTNDLYTVDPQTGDAKRVSSLTLGFEGSPRSCFDFNPQADRLRLVAASGQNLRVHVALGAVATDGPLEYAAGDANAGVQPHVGACAYTDNVADAPVTRLFDIDWERDALLLQEPPNDGALQTVGALGIDFGAEGGFDILTHADGAEQAFATSGGALYAIDLDSGAATRLGPLGDGSHAAIGLALSERSAP